jgi:hypothetical protein
MKKLTNLRFLTYGVILAIALLSRDVRRFVEVALESHDNPPTINPLETSSWLGQEESALATVLADARRSSGELIEPPFLQLPRGVRNLLEQQSPGYRGSVLRVHWLLFAPGFVVRTYQVYFYTVGKELIVLDVATWEDSYTM